MITVAGKDLTSGSARFEKIQVVLRTFRTWLLGTRLESRNSWFETQIYAKTRCNTHDFFASKAIEKTSTIIGEMFRRKSQKRGSWITVLQLGWVVAKLGLLQTIKAAHHLCMIDKKLKGECCLGATTIYILRDITRIGSIEKYLIFAEKFFNSPLSKTISSYGILSSFNFFSE